MKTNREREETVAQTRRSYDALAREYAAHISGELHHRPRERDLLERFAKRYQKSGPICDLGCGPGHVSEFVRQLHPHVFGLDISYQLLVEAQLAHCGMDFVQGNMLSLPLGDGSLGGLISFYSLIHFDDLQLNRALGEMKRALRPRGGLLLGFHVGTNVEQVTELWGIAVELSARFFLSDDLAVRLKTFGFLVAERFERDPYPELEYPSVRGYIWAEKQIAK